MAAPGNPLSGWTVDRAAVIPVGRDLRRPECVLAEPDGTLWAADARGGVMRIDPTGYQTLVAQRIDPHFDMAADAARSLLEGTLPNGLAFARNGDILIANFGTDALEVMTRTGETRTLHRDIDGVPLGKVNFVLRDSRDRLWITISTRVNPWSQAMRRDLTDGYIALLDERGLRVVADGLAFANEIRLDADEQYLYAAETTGRRVRRYRVAADGALTDEGVYGPAALGTGFIDGIAFDAVGNLWATMVMAERLIAITPEGEVLTLLDDGNPSAIEKVESEFASGAAVSFDSLLACAGRIAPWLASITFGGPDLSTVYLGSLRGTNLASFRSPVAGLPMVHWLR